MYILLRGLKGPCVHTARLETALCNTGHMHTLTYIHTVIAKAANQGADLAFCQICHIHAHLHTHALSLMEQVVVQYLAQQHFDKQSNQFSSQAEIVVLSHTYTHSTFEHLCVCLVHTYMGILENIDFSVHFGLLSTEGH